MNHSLSTRRLAGASTFVFALALLSAPGLRAQENPCAAAASNPCAANPCAMKEMDKSAEMDEWMTKMATKLELSDEQVTAIKPILMASHEGSEAIMAKYDGEKTDEAKAEMKALQKDTMYKLDEVLTEEQMEKLHAMMDKEMNEEKHGEKMEKKEKKEKGY